MRQDREKTLADELSINVIERKDKAYRGNASQFFVAGELCRRGFVAVVTLGNCPNTDILCSNSEGTKFVHIQVKTFRPSDKTCSVGMKAHKKFGDSFFWVLSGIPKPGESNFEYYIIPSEVMASHLDEEFDYWLKTPGRKKPHDPNNTFRCVMLPPFKEKRFEWIKEYYNRWDLVEDKLS